MKRTIMALLMGGCLFTSCMSPPKTPPNSEITNLAREKVINTLKSLDAASVLQIQTNQPEIKWRTIDWYLDYEISWHLLSNQKIIVKGTWSDRDKLKYSRVQSE